MSIQVLHTKKCSRCKIEKELNFFSKRSNYKFGVSCRCIECDRRVNKLSYNKHKNEYKEKSKIYRLKNIEKIKQRNKEWQLSNPGKAKVYQKKSYDKNPRRFVNARLKYKYGIDLEEYNKMYAQQNGLCAICDKKCNLGVLCVDHDHKTGKVRGLLCRKCNTAIGFMGDEQSLFIKAIVYLTK